MSQTIMDITFRKVVPEVNTRRFYRVIVTRNLLGESVLVSQWGRIGTCGQRREKALNNANEAQLAGAASVLERLKRGYIVVPGFSFVDKSIEQAVALDYLCTLRRSSKVVADAAQHLVATLRPTHTASSNKPEYDAPQQARIESILKASQRLSTRSGASLKVTRAENLVSVLTGSNLQHSSFGLIMHATGLPRRGWPAHQRRSFR